MDTYYVCVDIPATGSRIKELAMQRGITPEDFRRCLGLGCVQTIYKWYKGQAIPSIDNLIMIAHMLDVKLDDLIVIMDPGSEWEKHA